MPTQKQQEIFAAYSSAVPLVFDMRTLDALANQCLDDMRLTEKQRDALLALLERRSDMLHFRHAHRRPT